MIASRLRMQVSQQKRDALLEVLGYIIDRIRGQPGCIECRLSSDLEDEDEIIFEELWRSRKDLEEHLRSTHYGYVLEAMELANRPPEIAFLSETSIGDMEVIQAARGVAS